MAAHKKLTVLLLFGGKSTEHEVSVVSARGIYNALDKNKYDVVLAGIDHDGRWQLQGGAERMLLEGSVEQAGGTQVLPTALNGGLTLRGATDGDTHKIDVVFPIIHGTGGEDGTLQGLLELIEVPYVGCGVLGSAVGMDKDVAKRLVAAAGIPVARTIVVRPHTHISQAVRDFTATVGFPVFVKPASLGSSVGVVKVADAENLQQAIEAAFFYDTKVLIEEGIVGREIEVAVLGNDVPEASVPGEVTPTHDFYSYEAKYIDEAGAALQIPAALTKAEQQEAQRLACKIFQTLELSGMARVDFFYTPSGTWVFNEVNTAPGFTPISMYPKLWECSGLPYPQLLDRLIELARQRYEVRRAVQRKFKIS
ncbi:MAG: D-alanine--D-alanine ligase family protein [Patescibacteria group bacterium]